MSFVRAQWDRVLGWALIAAGGVALLLAYDGIRHSPYVADQLSYLASGGVGGLWLAGVGSTLLVTANLADEWRQLDDIRALVARALDVDDGGRGAERLRELQSRHGPSVAERVPSGAPTTNGEAGEATAPAAAFVATVLAIVSAGIVLGGWAGAARATKGSDAFEAAALGGLGLVVLGVGSATMVIRARVRIRRRAAADLRPFAAASAAAVSSVGEATVPRPSASVRLPGARWTHAAGCQLLAGREREAVPVGAGDKADRCPLCGG